MNINFTVQIIIMITVYKTLIALPHREFDMKHLKNNKEREVTSILEKKQSSCDVDRIDTKRDSVCFTLYSNGRASRRPSVWRKLFCRVSLVNATRLSRATHAIHLSRDYCVEILARNIAINCRYRIDARFVSLATSRKLQTAASRVTSHLSQGMTDNGLSGAPGLGGANGGSACRCSACLRPIVDRWMLGVGEALFHERCLLCQVCRLPLHRSCYARQGAFYCRNDYDRLFGRKCLGCGDQVPAEELVMRVGPGYTNHHQPSAGPDYGRHEAVFHVRCFVCVVCGGRLQKGDQFVVKQGQLFCRADYEKEVEMLQAFAQGDRGGKEEEKEEGKKRKEEKKGKRRMIKKGNREKEEEGIGGKEKTGRRMRKKQERGVGRNRKEEKEETGRRRKGKKRKLEVEGKDEMDEQDRDEGDGKVARNGKERIESERRLKGRKMEKR
ncbi:hypothetical protein LSTR_LSTR005196 [Laodelphax striatellus]|uniref:LIM zinc-binding domain-containing protein n=1 Tax=Laodelphax striatellus TaxID=195883 RepID=A0A482XNZ0_LAOST|nr:hypothetical protein LSTR_LSTR005196 [Laodelphax striatellus]